MALVSTKEPLISKQVQPPAAHRKMSGHHWLEIYDSDGHYYGLVVLQWNPGAKAWSHSGCVGSGFYVETRDFKYLCYCPIPE